MSQDTRRDPRAKIVALNVRYKSATVDEFIEHHSHDVSKGGMFVKTPNPFPPGTLLKFEIRTDDDKAVIAGVGRVVWKREDATGGTERPSGMGIKFIKLDDASRTVIDKLTAQHPDAGAAYDRPAGVEVTRSSRTSVPPAGGPDRKGTIIGIGVPSSAPPGPMTGSVPPTAEPPTKPNHGAVLGSVPSKPPAAASASTPPDPDDSGEAHVAEVVRSSSSSTSPMFPKTGGEADMPPPAERTLMKHTSELLEEVLRETGVSSDDVGTNPLFSGVPSTRGGFPDAPSSGSTSPKAPASIPPPPSTGPSPLPPDQPSSPDPSPVPRSVRSSVAPLSTRAPSVRPPQAVEALAEVEAEKKSNVPLVLAAIIAVVTVGYVLWSRNEETRANGTPSAPTVTATQVTPPIPTSPQVAPPDLPTAAPVPTPAPIPTSVPVATPAPIPTPAPVAPPTPAVTAKPVVAPPPTSKPEPVVVPKPVVTAAPLTPPAPKPEVTATPNPETTAAPKPPPAPKPPTTPKPPAEDPDNPY
ncbi:MAG: TIGR02266 family protein [Polyangiaceae bacterium]